MKIAYKLAEKAASQDEVPVGCVIVYQDKVIASVKGNCCSLCGHNGVVRLAACACAFHLVNYVAVSVRKEEA